MLNIMFLWKTTVLFTFPYNPTDPPSKPGKPKATNWDKDFVDLEWAKPKSDGGADITKYIVEKRDVVSSRSGDCRSNGPLH